MTIFKLAGGAEVQCKQQVYTVFCLLVHRASYISLFKEALWSTLVLDKKKVTNKIKPTVKLYTVDIFYVKKVFKIKLIKEAF